MPKPLGHALFTLFLLLKQLALAGDIAPVTLGSDVFTQGGDGLTRDDLAPNGRLKRHLEELPRNKLFEALAQKAPAPLGPRAVHNAGKRIHRLSVHQNGELHQITLPVA